MLPGLVRSNKEKFLPNPKNACTFNKYVFRGFGIEIFYILIKFSVFSHPKDIFTALFNYLAEISATWQIPPLIQLRMLRGIHSTEYKKHNFFRFVTFYWHLRTENTILYKRPSSSFLFKTFLF